MMPSPHNAIEIALSAVILAVRHEEPVVASLRHKKSDLPCLPSGPFETSHRTLEQGLRAWARTEGGVELGYVEQLYTFADKDRATENQRHVSIGYLALMREESSLVASGDSGKVYDFFPWEDRRNGVPEPITSMLMKGLVAWKEGAAEVSEKRARAARIALCFPSNPKAWNEELVLQRYELLWEAGLIAESQRNMPTTHTPTPSAHESGAEMAHDHRRILATGLARLRAKIKYRPVVFELMPDRFTLLQLQTTVEALAGLRLHKQNFRRLVLSQGLVEETPITQKESRGRPARLFAFRREILTERAYGGTKLPRGG